MIIWRPTGLAEKGEKVCQRRTQHVCNPADLSQIIRNILSARRPKPIPPGVETGHRHAAVLVPLLCPPEGEDWSILFTKRTNRVAHHKGQISFPGGAVEVHDSSPLETMLRESEEEIGLKAEAIDVLGSLDDALTMASNFIIHPFVGVVPSDYAFEINPFEVESILTVPLHVFQSISGESHAGEILYQGKAYRSPIFTFEGEVIWGATARVMENFMALIGGKLPLPVEVK
jgi:8-oxo-dGTP pyrophosphatase MutT (NUDIX family)